MSADGQQRISPKRSLDIRVRIPRIWRQTRYLMPGLVRPYGRKIPGIVRVEVTLLPGGNDAAARIGREKILSRGVPSNEEIDERKAAHGA